MPSEMTKGDNAEHSLRNPAKNEGLGAALFEDSYSNSSDGRGPGKGQKTGDGDRPSHADTNLPTLIINGGDGTVRK
jgi:hypothetical protein